MSAMLGQISGHLAQETVFLALFLLAYFLGRRAVLEMHLTSIAA